MNNDVVSIPPNYPTSTTTPPTHSPTPNSERPVVLLNAGALLIMAPTMILFIFLQRYFIRAMLAGSVKG